jgi:hypothetical protein
MEVLARSGFQTGKNKKTGLVIARETEAEQMSNQ